LAESQKREKLELFKVTGTVLWSNSLDLESNGKLKTAEKTPKLQEIGKIL